MNTLRAKLMALIVVAIIVVTVLATGSILLVLDLPRADPLLEQVRLLMTVAGKSEELKHLKTSPLIPQADTIGFHAKPAAGQLLEGPTQHLQFALRRINVPYDAQVTALEPSGEEFISLRISNSEWLVLPADMPVPNTFWPVIGWLLLITTGAAGIALIVVYRMTQPLWLIQHTISLIGPSGEVPLLPESGPLETQAMARAINVLSSRLKAAMESRMRLVAAAGHDLRTPLTRMRLRAEFLEGADRDKWFADLDELDHIANSAIRLVREETEGTPPDAIRLDVMVGEVVSELREMHLDVCLEHATTTTVRARPLSLKRALRNVIINASTHGGGAAVTVGVDGTRAVVSIEDRGPGIPESLLQRACEPFFRVDASRKSPIPGAGLGLAIAKEIIQRNMGHLELANRPGGGLRQLIMLPLCATEK